MKIIVIAGASGAGKSHLLQEISDHSVEPIKKMSTRSPRDYELSMDSDDLDLVFNCSKRDIKQHCKDFVYEYEKNTYGINPNDLDLAISEGKIPMVIVRDCDIIKRLKERYDNKVYVIYVHTTFSGEELAKKLKECGRTDIDITKRDQRTERDLLEIQQHPRLFDKVIFNNFEPNVLSSQFRKILDSVIRQNMSEYGRVFAIMPFNEESLPSWGDMETAVTEFRSTYSGKNG